MPTPLRNRSLSRSRLRLVLLTFLVALLVPLAALIWHAYGQLKWEAFHQYRGSAETLTRQVDVALVQMIEQAEARTFSDYAFAIPADGATQGLWERSPLAAFPVRGDVVGTLGYFQVGPNGEFNTPLLPDNNRSGQPVSLSAQEQESRSAAAAKLQQILSDNRLVEPRPGDLVAAEELVAQLEAGSLPEAEADYASVSREIRDADDQRTTTATFRDENTPPGRLDTQLAFDRLNQAASGTGNDSLLEDRAEESMPQRQRVSNKVSDLNLDSAYEQKSAELEAKKQEQGSAAGAARSLGKRKETAAQPLSEAVFDSAQPLTTISTFESEIDPYEFSMLASGHFVLFRRVWRDGERSIQGLVLDQSTFITQAIAAPFQTTGLPALGSLLVAYQGEVLETLREPQGREYLDSVSELTGNLLYRARLSSPFDGLELIFSLDRLPPGPGAPVLAWVSLVLLVVVSIGFLVLYRAGVAQLELNRKQQDFVSAVSHELKTPITSIRMYAEMLNEGWADEEKKQSYYTYIQDESERLSRLVSNVLQLAKLTRNEAPLSLKPQRAEKLLDLVQSKTQSHCAAAGFELKLDCPPEAAKATIQADEDSFLQIMINLLDNAFKFSESAQLKQVDVACRIKGQSVSFSVRDYGPGIPKDQLKAIFQLFYRSESELTRETVGTGIGLAIVHQLTLAMGGAVDVINQDPGVLFKVTFPAVPDEYSD